MGHWALGMGHWSVAMNKKRLDDDCQSLEHEDEIYQANLIVICHLSLIRVAILFTFFNIVGARHCFAL